MAYKLKYSDYPGTDTGPPDPERWVGPPGPQGVPGPAGPPGLITGGDGVYLPLSGGTVNGDTHFTTNIDADAGLFAGAATLQMRQGYSGGVEYRTWVGVSDAGYMSYYDQASLSAFYAVPGFPLAAVAAVRSSDQPGSGTANIGFSSYAVSDGASANYGFTWSFYGSNRRMAGGSTTLGMELSMGNLAPTVELNPYLTGNTGSTIGLWMSSGSEAHEAGLTVYPGSAAISVVSNGSTWAKGIVFGSNALYPNPGNGTMKAMQLPAKGEIQWTFDLNGARSSFIRGDATAAGGTGIVFTTTAFNVVNAATETSLFQVTATGDANVEGALQVTGHSYINGGASVTGLLNTLNGIRFDGTPTSVSDLSFHLNLSGNTYGINAYGGAMNLNVPAGANFDFVVAGGSIGFIDVTGINYLPVGQTGARAGAFSVIAVGDKTGPTWTTGTAVPAATAPVGSIYSRTGGGIGSTLYVRGASAWAAVAGV